MIAMGSPRAGTERGESIITFKYNDISSGWDQYGSMLQGLSSGEAGGCLISFSNPGYTMVVGR